MHVKFLPFLADPVTRTQLQLTVLKAHGDQVLEGTLTSERGTTYPIVRGVPHFVPDAVARTYIDTFSYQWSKWSRVQFESENRGRVMEGHTRRMWERITGIRDEQLNGAVIAEFGCGSGRFIEVVRNKGGRVIGLDMSEAVEAARESFEGDTDVLICQADVLAPPLAPDSLDGAFSIGVLHHTPDPLRGFREIVKAVRPGGWVAVSVYGKGGYYDWSTVRFYRRIFQALWPLLGPRAPLAYSWFAAYVLGPLSYIPVLGLLLRAALPFVRLPDARWSFLDTFDSVTPKYQSAHESFEVFQWFRQNGLRDIAPSDWGFTAYHGIRVPGQVAVEAERGEAGAGRAGTRGVVGDG